MTAEEAQRRAVKGIAKGLLKTMSKMGISTIPSYCGAQIFEAIGLAPDLVERHFTGTPSRDRRHRDRDARGGGARPARPRVSRARRRDLLPVVGLYAWRRDGEHHQWNPETIALLQHAVRGGGFATYEEYAATVNDDSARRGTLRGLMAFRFAEDGGIPLDEVEPAAEIVKRFVDRGDVARLARRARRTRRWQSR